MKRLDLNSEDVIKLMMDNAYIHNNNIKFVC